MKNIYFKVDIDPKVEGRLADENGNITREDFIKFAQVEKKYDLFEKGA